MKHFLVLLAALLLLTLPLPAQTDGGGEPVIARVGDVFVAEREFLERFELSPGSHRRVEGGLEVQKLKTLYSMIAEKLLAQEALATGLDRTETFRRAMLELTKLLVRDELYHLEVALKIAISSEDLNRGIAEAQTELLVSFLFFETGGDANFVRSQVKAGSDLDRIRIDSSMNVLRDTATVIWGDAEEAVESAAYSLEEGEISMAVQAGDGYYLLRLDRVQASSFYTGLPPHVLRERVEARLRARRETARAEEFIREIMGGKVAYSPSEVFGSFEEKVTSVFANNRQEGLTSMTPSMAEELRVLCGSGLTDTLIIAGERIWTVSDAITDLTRKGFSVRGDVQEKTPLRLYESFREWAEQEILAQEGFRRGLDGLPVVQKRIEPWRDAYLAALMKAKLYGGITVSDAEVYAYMNSLDPNRAVPLVQVRELKTGSLTEMGRAFSELEDGATFQDVVGTYSIDPIAREQGGLTEFFPVTERPPVGEMAWELPIGERFGPLRDSAAVYLFEVVAKDSVEISSDTARFVQARGELIEMTRKRKLNLYLAQTGSQTGFEVYADRLTRLRVSTVPMLAFRFLGFGGRMFVVPFVEKEIEWMGVDPPQETIVP
jgi:parvulin-like peptidyl-prolyl isomerase